MAITYTYNEAEKKSIKAVDDSTTPPSVKHVPTVEANRDYAEILRSGVAIGDYVAE